jgi:hypothetical protein
VARRVRPVKQHGAPKGIDSRTWTRYATLREKELSRKMLFELEERWLHVVLIPAPEPCYSGHKVRRVVMQNPKWYSGFAAGRNHQVHRLRVEKALRRVCSGRVRGNGYEVDLLKIADREWPKQVTVEEVCREQS